MRNSIKTGSKLLLFIALLAGLQLTAQAQADQRGIFIVAVMNVFRGFYMGIAKTLIITWSTAAMAVVNIILDYGLIFGKLLSQIFELTSA